MTSIGEAGVRVNAVFDGRGAELAGVIGTAINHVDTMREEFADVTRDSGNEKVTELHGRLDRVREALGEAAIELSIAQEVSSELLSDWQAATVTTHKSAGSAAITKIDDAYNQKNPNRLSAVRHRAMYERMGIDLATVGCVMLDTEPIIVSDVIDEADLYTARDPQKNPYANGVRSETVPHITLLHGLLQPGLEIKGEVDTVLKGWKADNVTIEEVTYFAGVDPNEPFDCIVAKIKITDALKEANDRLQMLPHINLYPGGYRAHISLAYLERNPGRRDVYIKTLNERYAGKTIRITGLNYGR